MTLFGLMWAVFAPVLLLAAIGVLALAMGRRRGALALAAVLVLAPIAILWSVDWREFRAACAVVGAPIIRRTAKADGIYLASGTANSFGMRYLTDEGFSWVEAADYRYRGTFVRYSLDPNGVTVTDSIGAPTARYRVEETFTQPYPHTGMSITRIVDQTTGEELARAGSGSFSGGMVKWVLGAWGSSSCPSAMTDPDGFNLYYHLAKRTLR